MIKEIVKDISDKQSKIGFGIKQDESGFKKLKGEFFITLKYKDGSEEKCHFPNVIVDSASLLIARLLASGQSEVDPTGPAHGLWVLAVGTGDITWDKTNPPLPTAAQTQLESELARKRFSNVVFVKTDGSGLPSNTVTNILDLQCIFNESEAIGGIMEMGLFGGDADPLVANSGTMVNYRTMAIISKSNIATLSIVFRITC